MGDERDPAEISAERVEEVRNLIQRAKAHEGKADAKNILAANNLRLKALCVHFHLE